MDWTKIILGVLALFAAGLTFKIISRKISKRSSSFKIVSQKNNIAQGDIVAGDKISKHNNK